jgi:hypothetical protein
MIERHDREEPSLALKIGIAGALTIGALASGYFVSRQGRRVLREAMQGRRRTRLEDRVLDLLWGDRNVGVRTFDVQEITPGVIALSGGVRSEEERQRALAVASDAKDVSGIEDRLSIEAEPVRRRRLVGRRSRA